MSTEIFDAAAPTVVYIFTRSGTTALRSGQPQGGAGSGFIWDAVGHVVTNFHVVKGAREIAVRLDSGEAVAAKLIGAAPDYDLAVVKLAESRADLKPIPVGSSTDLKVGQSVFAIGNPFGLSRSLTTGIISALNRHLPTASGREIHGVIQTDAAINPGNSGGPLLDSAGRLIGVNTAILSRSGSSAGVGFAVPVDVVNRIVPLLIRDGKVPRPGIGITIISEETSARLGIVGLMIGEVLPNSSAARAGLFGVNRRTGNIGDIITRVEGKAISSVADFAAALEEAGIGNEIELTVLRKGRELTIELTVMDIS